MILLASPRFFPIFQPSPALPGCGNRHQPRPGKPPMNGARERARRLRAMQRAAVKAAR